MVPEGYLAGMQEDDSVESDGTFLRAIPGGKGASQEQFVVAFFVSAALVFLIAVRKGFKEILAR